MTSGERMVWAAAFERGIFEQMSPKHAAVNARAVVERIRSAADHPNIDEGTRAMLADILSSGADR